MFKSQKVCYITEDAKKKKAIPPPNKYIKNVDWKIENKTKNLQKFGFEKKMTMTARILKRRELKEPGPSSYKPKDSHMARGVCKIKAPMLYLMDDIKFRSKEIPAPWKFKKNFVSK